MSVRYKGALGGLENAARLALNAPTARGHRQTFLPEFSMAIALEFFDFIVPIKVIEAKYAGGWVQ